MSSPAEQPAFVPEWTLGDRLRKVRRLLGLSQSEFARQLTENAKSYSSWESDQALPRNVVALAKRVEAMSGVPAVWVLGIEPPAPGRPVTTPEYWSGIEATVTEFPQVSAPQYADTAALLTARDHSCELGEAA